MKNFILLAILVPLLNINAQKIGELAEEKKPMKLPDNAAGVDLMIGEGGFGLGGFYRHQLSTTLTGFIDFSISESKHSKEIERFDIFGYPLPIYGKKNRVFVLPLNVGVQYRLFSNSLTDNLRPYLSMGVGPSMFVTTPAQQEFFKSFGDAKARFGVGGYVGFGANFGANSNNLTGINIRYYYLSLLNDGIEQYFGEFEKNLQHVALTINIGIMY